MLFSRRFAGLVIIASALSVPPAYFALWSWLNRFAFRIGLSPWIFLAAGGIALAVAVMTVGAQSLRVALRNPVDSLRYE